MSKLKTLESINRFDLEQEIMNCWHVVDDIKTLTNRVYDSPQPLTEDELGNALIGLQTIYQMKFEILFETFEQCIKNGQLDAKPEVQFGSPNGC